MTGHVVGWTLPAAGVAQNPHPFDRVAERRADPDVVEAPSLVGLRPIRRAIAPPSVELLIVGHEFAQRVDPGSRGLGPLQFVDLDRRVADNAEKRLVAPDVVLERRDVEIADQDRPLRRRLLVRGPIDHFVDEGELVGELDVDLRVRLVAARGDIEIMEFEPLRFSAQDDMQMAGVALGAEVSLGERGERDARNDRDAVIALLPVDRDMGIARVPERAEGEIAVRAFRFLQAQNIRLVLGEIADDEIDAQAHRIDVPRGDRKRHERLRGAQTAACPAGGGAQASLDHCPQAASSPPVAELIGRQVLVDVEQRRVGLGLQIDIEQGDDGLEALRVDHRPLLQRKGRSVEDEGKMRSAAERRLVLDLDRDRLPSWATLRTFVSRARSMWSERRNLSGVWPMKYSSCVLSFWSMMATLRPSATISKRGGLVYSNRMRPGRATLNCPSERRPFGPI